MWIKIGSDNKIKQLNKNERIDLKNVVDDKRAFLNSEISKIISANIGDGEQISGLRDWPTDC